MEQRIIEFVNSLYESYENTPETQRLKAETVGRIMMEYTTLVNEGKGREEAYAIAVSRAGGVADEHIADNETIDEKNLTKHKVLTAIGVMLCVLCPVPVIGLQNELGVIFMFIFIAVAVGLFIISSSASKKPDEDIPAEKTTPIKKAVSTLLWAIVLLLYFMISFGTGAWYITWLMFPIGGALEGVISAVFDLVGGNAK